MLIVQVKTTETSERSGVARATNKPYCFFEQEAWVELNGEVRRIKIAHDKPEQAYAAGVYFVSGGSMFVDGFSSLKLGRLKLVPIAELSAHTTALVRAAKEAA